MGGIKKIEEWRNITGLNYAQAYMSTALTFIIVFMNNEKEIQILKAVSGKRIYTIHVKQGSGIVQQNSPSNMHSGNQPGQAKYVTISENFRREDGTQRRYYIMIFEEDVHEVVKQLHKVLQYFPLDKEKNSHEQGNHENKENDTGSGANDAQLKKLLCQNYSVQQVSGILKCSCEEIWTKIHRWVVIDDKNHPAQ